jgi:hypothetical protein
MNAAGGFLLAVAGVVVAAGCAWPTSRTDPAPRGPSWVDAGTPASNPPERETRYYVDETGAVWDDRGVKQGPKP